MTKALPKCKSTLTDTSKKGFLKSQQKYGEQLICEQKGSFTWQVPRWPTKHLMNKIISMYRFFHVRVNAQI